ncbi:hypothetical protein O9993_15915 [Vibrio lentus]|nr:hypothetical protein [Vibrio lentus]
MRNKVYQTQSATPFGLQVLVVASLHKIVPMKTRSQVADFSYGGSWNTYSLNCIAEYDDKVTGKPDFLGGTILFRNQYCIR